MKELQQEAWPNRTGEPSTVCYPLLCTVTPKYWRQTLTLSSAMPPHKAVSGAQQPPHTNEGPKRRPQMSTGTCEH